jgi:hypothetical protein
MNSGANTGLDGSSILPFRSWWPVGLGALAGPLALLPLIDLGDAPNADCKALYQDARVQAGTTDRVARPGKQGRGKAGVSSAAN